MRYTIEIDLEVDPDHPYIDTLRSYESALELYFGDLLYDDDYLVVDSITVKETK